MSDDLLLRLEAARAEGDADAALAALDALARREPDAGCWPYESGVILQAVGEIDRAIGAYRRAVAAEPGHASAWVNLGRLLDDRRAWDEALACYERAIALPEGRADAIAWTNRGNTLLSLERFEEALASYEQALAIEPDGEPLRGRQTALGWLGRVAEANAARPLGTRYDRGALHEHRVPVGDRRLVVRWWAGRHTRPDALEELARFMGERVARLAGVPPGLDDGVRIGWGWSGLVVRARGDDLVLCEPDYAEGPFEEIVWEVGFTLQTTFMHRMLHDLTGLEPCGCTFRDTMAFVPGVLQEHELVLKRLHETDEDGASGWVAGPAEPAAFDRAIAEGRLAVLRTGELPSFRPHLVKVLTLPPGCTVRFQAHAVVSVRDAEGVERWGS